MRDTALYANQIGEAGIVQAFNTGNLKKSSKGNQYAIINPESDEQVNPGTEEGSPQTA